MNETSLHKRRYTDHIASTRPVRARAGNHAMEITLMASTTSVHAPRYLSNDEAAAFLNLSPRTLEKQRVIGGGPRFRKFGRRVVYALDDLETWSNERVCESTSDSTYFAAR